MYSTGGNGAAWSNDISLEFLENYKSEPLLWDPKHPDHKNKVESCLAWERIKDIMSIICSVPDLKRKKESLMTTYRLQYRKKRDNPNHKCYWFAYEFMDSFLNRIYNEKDEFSVELLHSSDEHQYLENIPIKKERRTFSSTQSSNYTPCIRPFAISHYGTSEQDTKDDTDLDECELYGKLLAKKMRRLNQRQREIVMHEIDNLMFRARMNTEDNISRQRLRSESPAYVVSSGANNEYEAEYLEDPMD